FASFKPDKPLENLMILLDILSVLSRAEVIPLSSRLYKASKNSDHRLSKITNHVLNNLNEKLSVDSVADLANMSSPAFCRWFKKSSGNTFIHFVNKSRIESACHHLVGSDKSMKEIAFLCGFESPNHFNHTFRKYLEVSPTRYRSENMA
ncbi:MAG: AraC family transcriptional regulator, partial [Cyclobacteriaceae bacterium]